MLRPRPPILDSFHNSSGDSSPHLPLSASRGPLCLHCASPAPNLHVQSLRFSRALSAYFLRLSTSLCLPQPPIALHSCQIAHLVPPCQASWCSLCRRFIIHGTANETVDLKIPLTPPSAPSLQAQFCISSLLHHLHSPFSLVFPLI